MLPTLYRIFGILRYLWIQQKSGCLRRCSTFLMQQKKRDALLLFRQLGSGIARTTEQTTLSPRRMYAYLHASMRA